MNKDQSFHRLVDQLVKHIVVVFADDSMWCLLMKVSLKLRDAWKKMVDGVEVQVLGDRSWNTNPQNR